MQRNNKPLRFIFKYLSLIKTEGIPDIVLLLLIKVKSPLTGNSEKSTSFGRQLIGVHRKTKHRADWNSDVRCGQTWVHILFKILQKH